MRGSLSERKKWLIVAAYAIGMAWVESAVVFYLRTLANRIDPHQVGPLPEIAGVAPTELVREAATLIMLLTVGLLAGRDGRCRWGYAAIAFGVWDIFYYVFLKVICGWPNSPLDWDILFLLPLPWWGPVLSPVLIAVMMIIWGTLATQWEHQRLPSEWKVWGLNLTGIALALYVFMADTIRAVPHGEAAIRAVVPVDFKWGWFTVALLLMAAPIIHLAAQIVVPRSARAESQSSTAV